VGNTGQAKLIDFGLAVESLAGEDEFTAPGTVLGTPRYMSPEQFKGMTLGPASDLFSLGLVVYECLTGEPAYSGGLSAIMHKIVNGVRPIPPSELNPALPKALDDFTAKILAVDPADRFADAARARDALIRAIGSSEAPEPTP
jgi:eukaryotic-like serine/threonine-protein kinase